MSLPTLTVYPADKIPNKETMTDEEFADSIHPYLNFVHTHTVPELEALRDWINSVVSPVKENLNSVNSVSEHIANIDSIANSIDNVDIVSADIDSVNSVANDIWKIKNVEAKLQAVEGVDANLPKIESIYQNISNINYLASELPAIKQDIDTIEDFTKVYLGAKSTPPSERTDGTPLQEGDLYFDTVSSALKVWKGNGWEAAYASVNDALVRQNNLSDLSDVAMARENLGVYSKEEIGDLVISGMKLRVGRIFDEDYVIPQGIAEVVFGAEVADDVVLDVQGYLLDLQF